MVATFAPCMMDVWFCMTLVLRGCKALILVNYHCWVCLVLVLCLTYVKFLYYGFVVWLFLVLIVMCEGTSKWGEVQLLAWELLPACSLKVFLSQGWTLRGSQNSSSFHHE